MELVLSFLSLGFRNEGQCCQTYAASVLPREPYCWHQYQVIFSFGRGGERKTIQTVPAQCCHNLPDGHPVRVS